MNGRRPTVHDGSDDKAVMVRGFAIGVLAVLMSACSLVNQSDVADDDRTAGSEPPVVAAPTKPSPGTIPFHLDVTNQSFDEPEVRLRIWLDGRPIIDDVFPVENQHHVVRYDLHLEPGDHDVRVTEPGTRFELDRTFTLHDESWANVSYWGASGNEPRLDWRLSPEELVYG